MFFEFLRFEHAVHMLRQRSRQPQLRLKECRFFNSCPNARTVLLQTRPLSGFGILKSRLRPSPLFLMRLMLGGRPPVRSTRRRRPRLRSLPLPGFVQFCETVRGAAPSPLANVSRTAPVRLSGPGPSLKQKGRRSRRISVLLRNSA